MSIIVLISVIITILSATTTEVTIKGLGSLVFAILALTLGIRSWEISRKEANSGPRVKGQTILEPTTTRQSRNRTSLRLAIGGVATGAVLAIITAVLISIVLGQVLGRLS